MLLSNDRQFDDHVKALEQRFPGVPSIGCIGMCYQIGVTENGVGVIAFSDGVSAAANVLEQVSVMPVKYIQRLERDVQTVGGSGLDTVCIDFCSGNDACVLTTINTVLHGRNIGLVGGTGDQGRVSANGRVCRDAVAYALVRNQNGRVKTYKENIYHQLGSYRFVASDTDRANYILGSLNGKPARTPSASSTGTIPASSPSRRSTATPWPASARSTTPTCSSCWSWGTTGPLCGTPSARSPRTSRAARPSFR